MNKNTLAIAVIALSLLIQAPSEAAGGKFPGKGNKKDWQKAAKTYVQGVETRKKGDIDGAMKLYEQAITIYPYDGDFYYNLAINYARDKKQFDKAEELIKKAVELNPENYEFNWEQAAIFIEQNKLEPAKAILTNAQKLKKTEEQQKELDGVLKQINERLTAVK
jgi:tetratricopeptide (TPR) repeat protein